MGRIGPFGSLARGDWSGRHPLLAEVERLTVANGTLTRRLASSEAPQRSPRPSGSEAQWKAPGSTSDFLHSPCAFLYGERFSGVYAL